MIFSAAWRIIQYLNNHVDFRFELLFQTLTLWSLWQLRILIELKCNRILSLSNASASNRYLERIIRLNLSHSLLFISFNVIIVCRLQRKPIASIKLSVSNTNVGLNPNELIGLYFYPLGDYSLWTTHNRFICTMRYSKLICVSFFSLFSNQFLDSLDMTNLFNVGLYIQLPKRWRNNSTACKLHIRL